MTTDLDFRSMQDVEFIKNGNYTCLVKKQSTFASNKVILIFEMREPNLLDSTSELVNFNTSFTNKHSKPDLLWLFSFDYAKGIDREDSTKTPFWKIVNNLAITATHIVGEEAIKAPYMPVYTLYKRNFVRYLTDKGFALLDNDASGLTAYYNPVMRGE